MGEMVDHRPEMVRRVCAAIDGAYSAGDTSWEKCARAAIEAMREPTKCMMESGGSVGGLCERDGSPRPYAAESAYRAMIDASLK